MLLINVSKSILLGLGNPLIDILVNANLDFLDKYGLESNDAILAEDKHKPMYKDMIKTFSNVQFIPGGSTQNSIRVAQWLIQKPCVTAQMGCVGEDEWSRILKCKMEDSGVKAVYQVNAKQTTGTCAVLVTGEDRSLCASLGAANFFAKSQLVDHSHWEYVKSAQFFYQAGFFLSVSVESALLLARHACNENKAYMTNLSAPSLCRAYKKQQMKLMPYVDVLFGNKTEFEAFAQEQNLQANDPEEVALEVAALPKNNPKRKRLVVLTQSHNPVIVAYDGKITTYNVEQLSNELIVDTNAAGDAFVGGFLAQYIQGKKVAECIRGGMYCATVIIQRHGCSLPDYPDFN